MMVKSYISPKSEDPSNHKLINNTNSLPKPPPNKVHQNEFDEFGITTF